MVNESCLLTVHFDNAGQVPAGKTRSHKSIFRRAWRGCAGQVCTRSYALFKDHLYPYICTLAHILQQQKRGVSLKNFFKLSKGMSCSFFAPTAYTSGYQFVSCEMWI